jgi:hypothetical protein
MTFELINKVVADFGPFARREAVHDRVTYGAVAAQRMVAQNAVASGAQTLDGTL